MILRTCPTCHMKVSTLDHRLRTGEDVFEIDMVQVFGPSKGSNEYFFADVHDDKVLDRIKELYHVVHGKSNYYYARICKGDCGRGGEGENN